MLLFVCDMLNNLFWTNGKESIDVITWRLLNMSLWTRVNNVEKQNKVEKLEPCKNARQKVFDAKHHKICVY